MKKATSITEVYINIREYTYGYNLTNFYKDEANTLLKFLNKNKRDIFYIFGKVGSGKTTFLEIFIQQNELTPLIVDEGDFFLSNIRGEEYIPSIETLLSDILYTIIHKDWMYNSSLGRSLNIKIDETKDMHQSIFFKKNIDEQLELVNKILNKNSKCDFIFIENIDYSFDFNKETSIIKELFHYLEQLNITCIIPISTKSENYTILDNNFIELKVTKDFLKHIILERVDESLITKRALNLAIDSSDNNINNLLEIIYKTSENVYLNNLEIIETSDIEKVISPIDNNNKVKKDIDKNKYINNIQIKDYFSIKNIKIENLEDKKEIYLVGENGDGKTIVLQSLTLAYKSDDNLPILANEYIKEIKKEYSINILGNENYTNNNLFAYGINRNKTDADDKDESGYSGLFDTSTKNATTTLNRPQDLFILNNGLTNEFKKKIENLLENKVKIEQIGIKTNFYESGKKIDFKVLSEGYKSTIIWLSDLLSRLIENQPEVTKIENFKAVVLVDEIDLYLHPKWRYKFVFNLRKIFPKIQFIMTTHSPTTILGASKDAVFYNVYKDKNGFTQLSEQYDDISDYSANILITSPLFNMDSAKSRAYNDKENYLSDDDYKKHQLNKKIDEMLENDSDEDIKLDILKQLEEYDEGI